LPALLTVLCFEISAEKVDGDCFLEMTEEDLKALCIPMGVQKNL